MHINPFGVIPKGHQSGKWRLIVYLSPPDGASVNDGIDQIVQGILRLGGGSEMAKMAKMDVRSAYRIVPVHPEDRCLLGMRWDGFDAMLLFGLRSAPKVFNAIADALEWILKSSGGRHLWHYLDDFITLGSPMAAAVVKRVCESIWTKGKRHLPYCPPK